jgi:hypothetical protein
MVSSGLLRRVALVRTCDKRVTKSKPILVTLMKEAPGSSETSVLIRATRCKNPEDTILHSHRRENLKSYILKLDYILSQFVYLFSMKQTTYKWLMAS